MSAPPTAVTINFDELPEATLPDLDPAAIAAAISGVVADAYIYRPRNGKHTHVAGDPFDPSLS